MLLTDRIAMPTLKMNVSKIHSIYQIWIPVCLISELDMLCCYLKWKNVGNAFYDHLALAVMFLWCKMTSLSLFWINVQEDKISWNLVTFFQINTYCCYTKSVLFSEAYAAPFSLCQSASVIRWKNIYTYTSILCMSFTVTKKSQLCS